jgi:hypothetical protein
MSPADARRHVGAARNLRAAAGERRTVEVPAERLKDLGYME